MRKIWLLLLIAVVFLSMKSSALNNPRTDNFLEIKQKECSCTANYTTYESYNYTTYVNTSEIDPVAMSAIDGNMTAWLSTYNATYAQWAYNQTLNLDYVGFYSTYNSTYASFVDTNDSSYIHAREADWNSTYNATYHNCVVGGTGCNYALTSTYNATYSNYAANVSKNWSQLAYDMWNTPWSDRSNSTLVPYTGATTGVDLGTNSLSAGNILGTFIGNGAQITGHSTFNQSYANYASNVSKNWSQLAYDMWNTPWSDRSNSTLVPYTGATSNVNLGTNVLLAERGQFNKGINVTTTTGQYSINGDSATRARHYYAESVIWDITTAGWTLFSTTAGSSIQAVSTMLTLSAGGAEALVIERIGGKGVVTPYTSSG
ncbi:MAG: hypothetical protein QME12_08710, partial [Nanoarchaeota archaeon]|nr:hypothetical protein [Nanoarchaeota archaeon]